MKKINIPSLLISSALLFGWQNALAKNEISCPDETNISDNIGALQNLTKQTIMQRLENVEKIGQTEVNIITIRSPEEYGYHSFEELGIDTLNRCQIWFKWQNTWVIIWYAKDIKPHYYLSIWNWAWEYVTSKDKKRLEKWSIEDCDSFNTNCRINEITKWIEKIISNKNQTDWQWILSEEIALLLWAWIFIIYLVNVSKKEIT